MKVIAVRFSKNTSCYIGLSSYDEILIYLKIVWKLIFNYIILIGNYIKVICEKTIKSNIERIGEISDLFDTLEYC